MMASRISPSNLQAFNNELVIKLERLREAREQIGSEIVKEESRKDDLDQQIHELGAQLERTMQSLTRKYALSEEYDRLIHETEVAYSKIVESSQSLLQKLERESETIASRCGRG
ncbi:sjogren syndrome nuclear autoantigen 1 [Fimicolochytrium jonesii]|uniref:sjogren syndrome nuclear autoantigen 1 n=1 Tax=Fimicolochytrium jonesii TaxID=1396493 RepID=UPI0022FDF887|nr:sjogren syndrome nuclear autoantigen 1 [Fimicolochytrium jonesii]KAI8815577.1 sjogren syndrome nuclear autoantigen 1 [Fimicolochytrium jonesii]